MIRTKPERRYWPCYCEENVWHLCAEPELEGRGEAYVVFISNPERQVGFRHQRRAALGEVVIWDYHVILLARGSGREWEVWDLDSKLGCPVSAGFYLDRTLTPRVDAPLFRLVPAAEYRRELVTDRRHMLRDDGSYISPPPPWPPIGEGSNLMRFVDMEESFLGRVFDSEGLGRWAGW